MRPPGVGAAFLALGCLLLTPSPASAADQEPADTLSLEEAISTALGRAPDMASARADLDAARSARWADWGAFLPTASASLGFSRSDFTTVTFIAPEGVSRRLEEPIEGTSKRAAQSLVLRWSLLEGGRKIAGLSSGAAELEAAAARRSLEELRTVGEVKRAYFAARKQERLAELAREQVGARERDLEVTRRRYRMAAADRADLLGARLEVEGARLALLDAEDAARAERRRLDVAMGLEPVSGRALADVSDPPEASRLDVGSLAARAVSANPELVALAADADAAAADLWAARSRYLPDISLGLSLSRSESLGPDGDLLVFDPENTGRGFSVSTSWDLFEGFGRKEATARASARLARARAARAKRRLELEKEVRDAAAEIRRRAERLAVLGRSVELAGQRLELARERYRLGTFGRLELQDAVDALRGAEERLVGERYDYLIAWSELEQRVGIAAFDGEQ